MRKLNENIRMCGGGLYADPIEPYASIFGRGINPAPKKGLEKGYAIVCDTIYELSILPALTVKR